MPDKWMTVAAAAAGLNVHTRTIERRIASGKIEARRADDGQVQVLINLPDQPQTATDPLETVKELAQDQVSLATGSASAIVRLAHADAERSRGELDLVRQEASRVRQGARIAWTGVAVMAVATCVAVGMVTYQMTRARDEIKTLNEYALRIESEARDLLTARDTARAEAQTARLQGAEATGRLAAYVEQAQLTAKLASQRSDKRPATQPADVIRRVVAAITGE